MFQEEKNVQTKRQHVQRLENYDRAVKVGTEMKLVLRADKRAQE